MLHICILNHLVVQCSLFVQQCTRKPADQQSHHLLPRHTITSAWGLHFLKVIAKKVYIACSRTNNKMVPLTKFNKYVYNEK